MSELSGYHRELKALLSDLALKKAYELQELPDSLVPAQFSRL